MSNVSKKNTITNKQFLSSTKTKKTLSLENNKFTKTTFEKEITVMFMEILMMVKLYHWKTNKYAQHKATDDFYGSLNNNMDTFIETLMGKTGMRIDLLKKKTINLIDLSNMGQFKAKLIGFRDYLIRMDNMSFIKSSPNTELLNIRDEIVGDINKLLYLLTLE